MSKHELRKRITELEKMIPVWKNMADATSDYYIKLNLRNGIDRLASLKSQLTNNK